MTLHINPLESSTLLCLELATIHNLTVMLHQFDWPTLTLKNFKVSKHITLYRYASSSCMVKPTDTI